jgi:hypothetical protein
MPAIRGHSAAESGNLVLHLEYVPYLLYLPLAQHN